MLVDSVVFAGLKDRITNGEPYRGLLLPVIQSGPRLDKSSDRRSLGHHPVAKSMDVSDTRAFLDELNEHWVTARTMARIWLHQMHGSENYPLDVAEIARLPDKEQNLAMSLLAACRDHPPRDIARENITDYLDALAKSHSLFAVRNLR